METEGCVCLSGRALPMVHEALASLPRTRKGKTDREHVSWDHQGAAAALSRNPRRLQLFQPP